MMRQLRFILVLLVFSAFSLRALAEQVVTIVESRQSVAPSSRQWTFEVPPFSVEHQVRLSLEARINHTRLAGSNPWIRVAINGQMVTRPDLLNKKDEFRLQNGIDLTWSKYGDQWRVLYSPDFAAAIKQVTNPYACPKDDPYRFVWDVTQRVRPGQNTLRIQHLKILAKPSTLVLRNVRVEVGRHISPPEGARVQPAPTGPLPTFVAQTPQAVSMVIELQKSGRMNLIVGGKRFPINTRTSLPAGAWVVTPESKTKRVIARGQSGQAHWTSGPLNIQRKVRVLADHAHISDTISNPTDALAGLIIEHRLLYEHNPEKVYLAGRPVAGETGSSRTSEHPSVFARWPGLGLGLVAEDDVFRVHIKAMSRKGSVALSDDRLGVRPKSSVILEWSIYPSARGDYWSFVNAVRRNWGCNFTIPGPFCFTGAFKGPHPAEWYADWIRKRDLKIVCGGIAKYANGKYAHGTGILFAPEFVRAQADWTRKLLSQMPEVRVLTYFHAQCCTEPGGEKKYADSRLLDAKGEHLGYPYRYRLPLYFPTANNSYGKALWGFVKTSLDDIGASGLYWDEMTHSVLRFAQSEEWDGVTVGIDRNTHELLGKLSSVPLLMQPLKLQIIQYLRERKKFLMANTQPMTRTMLEQKIIRFVETGTFSAILRTHLGCPLGLGNHDQEKTQGESARNVRRILGHGGIYYGHTYYREPPDWNFTSVMFPITPVELRESMVLGKERIHTAKSGIFGWPDGARARVYVVDANGDQVENPQVREVSANGQARYEIRMSSDQFAVLVKKTDSP